MLGVLTLPLGGDGRGFLCFVAAKLQRNSSEAKKRAVVTCKNLLIKSHFPVKIRKQYFFAPLHASRLHDYIHYM